MAFLQSSGTSPVLQEQFLVDDLAENVRNAESLSVSHTSSSTHLLIHPENSKSFAERTCLCKTVLTLSKSNPLFPSLAKVLLSSLFPVCS